MFGIDLKFFFLRFIYKEVMERFGLDKLDICFGMEFVDIIDIVKNCEFKVFFDAVNKGGLVRVINVKGCAVIFLRCEIDVFVEFVKNFRVKGFVWIVVESDGLKFFIVKFLKEEEINEILKRFGVEVGDLFLFFVDKDEIVFDVFGNLRFEIVRKLNFFDKLKFNFLWVVEFLFFEYLEEEGRFVVKYYLFILLMDEDIEFLEIDLVRVRLKVYDIVLNGIEIGGGFIRIYLFEI